MTPEQEREWAKWLAERPPEIRAVAEKYPPDCYRLKTDKNQKRSHYRIHSYSEPDPDHGYPGVTLTVIHGADSHSPGFGAFGINPEDLVRCGCGKWEWPNDTQQEAAEIRATLLEGTLAKARRS